VPWHKPIVHRPRPSATGAGSAPRPIMQVSKGRGGGAEVSPSCSAS
jgi:hypothetical protein